MMHCSRLAYAACESSCRCGNFDDATYVEGSRCDHFNLRVDALGKTNLSILRNMNATELAGLISSFASLICPPRRGSGTCPVAVDCAECLENWLRSPLPSKEELR